MAQEQQGGRSLGKAADDRVQSPHRCPRVSIDPWKAYGTWLAYGKGDNLAG
jgi:hypothetical protein